MIYHKPEVKEMLEKFGIPVLVEHSSYETDPLGRSEWIRFYGALLNREEKADELFDEMEEKVRRVLGQTSGVGDLPEEHPPEKRVAFFNINQQGLVTVRKAKDSVPTTNYSTIPPIARRVLLSPMSIGTTACSWPQARANLSTFVSVLYIIMC